MNETKQLHAVISGRVQGVSFRYFTSLRATELGVDGWVRNQPDGTVEVTAEAPQETLEKFLTFLNKGPSGAQVTRVDIQWLDSTGEFEGFHIR